MWKVANKDSKRILVGKYQDWVVATQLAFICLMSAMELRELCVKFVQSQQQDHQNEANYIVLVPFILSVDIFHALFWCLQCWLWISKCRLGSPRK